jgi:hypothetical protein
VSDNESSAPLPEQEDPTIEPWWRRSAPLAAGASLAIGVGTLWFGNMLNRVPLDQQSTLSYLLMLPLLLTVPAFSAAGLRLAWLAWIGAQHTTKLFIAVALLAAVTANLLAIARFAMALLRIFGSFAN